MEATFNPIRSGQGGWIIEADRQPSNRDRAQAVLYRLAGTSRLSPRSTRLSEAERFALNNGRWIAEVVEEDPAALALPPHQRPGVVRLAQLVIISGGAILESSADLGDDLTRLVVAEMFHLSDVVEGSRVLTQGRLERLRRRTDPDALAQELALLRKAADAELLAYMESRPPTADSLPFKVGTGERRDYQAACDLAQCLRMEGYSQRAVLERLNLTGYENERGRRCWHVHNVRRAGGWVQ